MSRVYLFFYIIVFLMGIATIISFRSDKKLTPSFDSTFSEQVIQQLSDYIITGIEKGKGYQFQGAPTENYFHLMLLTLNLILLKEGSMFPGVSPSYRCGGAPQTWAGE